MAAGVSFSAGRSRRAEAGSRVSGGCSPGEGQRFLAQLDVVGFKLLEQAAAQAQRAIGYLYDLQDQRDKVAAQLVIAVGC